MSTTHSEAPLASPNYPTNPGKAPIRWLVIVITFFFGIFGLIPALVGRSNARRNHQDDRGYLKAFWLTMIAGVVVWVALVVALVLAVGSTGNATATSNGPAVSNPKSGTVIRPLAVSPVDTVKAIENYLYTAYNTNSTAPLSNYCYTPTHEICPLFYQRAAQGFPGKFTTNVLQIIKENSAGTMIEAKISSTYTPPGAAPLPASVSVVTYVAHQDKNGSGLRLYYDHTSN